MAQDDSKYTKPGLRERIKDRIMAGSKGGKPGQWSARKAQMVASEYKKAGGGYKGGKGKKQKALKKWGKEKWMTKDEYEKRKKQRMLLNGIKTPKSNHGNSFKNKALPAQLRKSAKLHAGQADLVQGFLDDFIKKMKK